MEAVNHAVFMGMGEPLMNLDAVLAACERLPELGVATSNTGISTVGWVPGIERMTREGPPVRLALSLHAADEALRSELMPVNERYPLADVLAACLAWHEARRRDVFVEYLMLDGVNDRYEQAVQLAALLQPRARLQGQPDPLQPDRRRASAAQAATRSPRSEPPSRSAASGPPCASPAGATSTPPAGSWRPLALAAAGRQPGAGRDQRTSPDQDQPADGTVKRSSSSVIP